MDKKLVLFEWFKDSDPIGKVEIPEFLKFNVVSVWFSSYWTIALNFAILPKWYLISLEKTGNSAKGDLKPLPNS